MFNSRKLIASLGCRCLSCSLVLRLIVLRQGYASVMQWSYGRPIRVPQVLCSCPSTPVTFLHVAYLLADGITRQRRCFHDLGRVHHGPALCCSTFPNIPLFRAKLKLPTKCKGPKNNGDDFQSTRVKHLSYRYVGSRCAATSWSPTTKVDLIG